jgi:ParB-like chromosome segregation protein Spo0J
MKLQIDYIDVSSLVDYAKNARTHSAAQVTQIAASIREFGFNNPVLIDVKGEIIAGHGRVMAAKHLNMEQVPCVMLGHLSERQKRAYVLADNKIALNSGWDFAKLSNELSSLADVEFDLSLTGFDEQELDALLRDDASILPEGGLEPEKIPVSAHHRKPSTNEKEAVISKHEVECPKCSHNFYVNE